MQLFTSPSRELLLVVGVLIPQGPQAAGQVGEMEGVPAQRVDVVSHKGRSAVPWADVVGRDGAISNAEAHNSRSLSSARIAASGRQPAFR